VAYVYENLTFPDKRYYGEVEFQMRYKNEKGTWFKWLYIDPVLLNWEAEKAGWKFELLDQDEQFQYLGRLSIG